MLDPPLPEVAFVGRSNVGKSSLLNSLVGQRIAKTSGTPGKTRALNVFQVHLGTSLYFLDLPGYGYARVSQSDRVAFRRLVTHALRRPGVVGVVWLLDIRHEPSKDDRVMQDLLAATEARVLAVLTKSDKLPPGQRVRRSAALQASLGVDDDQIIMTSAQHGEGISDLRAAIAALTGTRAA